MVKLKNKVKVTQKYVEVRVNSRVYSKEAVFAAGYVFLDRAYILVDKDSKSFIVRFFPKSKKIDLKHLAHEFYNEILNYSHYFARAESNAEVAKKIIQSALFPSPSSQVEEMEDREIQELIRELEEEEEIELGKDTLKSSTNNKKIGKKK